MKLRFKNRHPKRFKNFYQSSTHTPQEFFTNVYPSRETLELMIEYKKEEVKLAELNLQLERERRNKSHNEQRDSSVHQNDSCKCKIKSKLPQKCNNSTLDKVELLNFGNENCIVFTRPTIEFLFTKYQSSDENTKLYWILSRDLLKLIWLNPNLPENQNLRYSFVDNEDSDEKEKDRHQFMVYYEDSWSPVYGLTIIREYLKGMLFRLEQLLTSEHVKLTKLRNEVLSNFDEFSQDFTETLKTQYLK